MENRKRMWNGRITLPVLNSLLHHTLEDDVYVDGESFAMLLEIQRTLAVFEPIGDDEARMIWLEIPRGTAEHGKCDSCKNADINNCSGFSHGINRNALVEDNVLIFVFYIRAYIHKEQENSDRLYTTRGSDRGSAYEHE